MTRQLSLTAAEWASVQPDGTLWLVREPPVCDDRRHYILRPSAHNPLGTRRRDVHDDIRCANPCGDASDGSRRLVHQVPVEFVQACEPCPRTEPYHPAKDCCPDCRIELVGPCPTCEGAGWDWAAYADSGSECDDPVGSWTCGTCFVQTSTENGLALGHCTDTVTLGHAYAIGQPLPIVLHVGDQPGDLECLALDADMVHHWPAGKPENGYEVDDCEATDLTDHLAHYGPRATLVGRWAVQLRVTP